MGDPLQALRLLARLHGVQLTYMDIRGRSIAAGPEALMRTVSLLGSPVTRIEDAADAVRVRRLELWHRRLEPVVVAWDGMPSELRLRVPDGLTSGRVHGILRLEDGHERSWTWDASSLPIIRASEVEGECFAVLRAVLPGPLPIGYHRLVLETGGRTAESVVLAAPALAWTGEERSGDWGAFAPLYALHSRRSWGAGDLTDFEGLLEWVREIGGSSIGMLPLLAAFLDRPFEPSPYVPASRLFWNEMYLDAERVPEFATCHRAREMLASPDVQEEIRSLRAEPLVDYRRQAALKRRVLEPLARSFFESPAPGRAEAFEQFLGRRPDAPDYARFRAAVEREGTTWQDWPEPANDGELQRDDWTEEGRRYHLYAQWAMHEQLEALADRTRATGRGLSLDLPLGVHPRGYDVWRYRSAFALGASAGAPPDAFFTKGQNWGFAPIHPERIRESGYRYLRDCYRHHLRCAGVLRIDHFMSFHRLFWIPEGMEGRDGVYVRYPAEEMYALLTLESHRHKSIVVGEDLGIVPPYVRPAMDRHRVQRMYVLQYELRPDPWDALSPAPPDSTASLNTHDMPPFASYLRGLDIADRMELGLLNEQQAEQERQTRHGMRDALAQWLRGRGALPEGEGDEMLALLHGALAFLRSGPTRLVQVNLEDLWLETAPQNVPGTGYERPNWRRKLRYGLEEMRSLPEVRNGLRAVGATVEEGTF